MQIIEELLEWNFRPSHFNYAANHILTDESKKCLKDSQNSLEVIIEKLPDGGELPAKEYILEVYFQFVENYQDPHFKMTARNIRYLIWALDFQPTLDKEKIILSNKLASAFKLIEQRWKDSFIISLWHILMRNWTDFKFNSNRTLFFDYLKGKCSLYDGKRSSLLNITQHIDFYQSLNSTQKYAQSIINEDLILSDANKLFKLKEKVLDYDYFSVVASDYLSLISKDGFRTDINLAKGVYKFLDIHKSKKTTLLLCAKIINNNVFNDNIDLVKSETVRLISDPIKKHYWRNSDLEIYEQQEVDQSRNKLRMLLNKEFVEVFFEKIVEDWRREKYWLKFVNDIDDLIIVGNKANYTYLKEIEEISNIVDGRYKVTRASQQTCALVMYIKDFVFVEFSDVGALYIYTKQAFETKINLNNIGSMNDLKKISPTKYACKNSSRYGYVELNNEGRITHQGDWEPRVNIWMRRYL